MNRRRRMLRAVGRVIVAPQTTLLLLVVAVGLLAFLLVGVRDQVEQAKAQAAANADLIAGLDRSNAQAQARDEAAAARQQQLAETSIRRLLERISADRAVAQQATSDQLLAVQARLLAEIAELERLIRSWQDRPITVIVQPSPSPGPPATPEPTPLPSLPVPVPRSGL